MGNGNSSRLEKMKNDLKILSAIELKDKYGPCFTVINFKEGDIYIISDDSHSSWFGGNLALKSIINNKIYCYTGHVCGGCFGKNLSNSYKSRCKSKEELESIEGFINYINTILKNNILTNRST